MGNSVQELLEMLYSMISEAWGLPLGAEKCVIERDKVLDLLDEIKAQFPVELAEAKRLVAARTEFIANAKREAESIRKVAEERARQMVDEQEIIRTAKAKSNEMVAAAENKSADLRGVWPTSMLTMRSEGRKRPYRRRWTKCASHECASAARRGLPATWRTKRRRTI
jgi:cell division septum initiation protein DivIVA